MGDLVSSIAQKKLDAVQPWIGLYIAVASAVCTLAMFVDGIRGLLKRKFWFPCKYFSLGPISLTLLGVAMKLPADLSNSMVDSPIDWSAKVNSLVLMMLAIAHFTPSLGSMSNKEIFGNVVALVILVFTIVANVLIQLIQLKPFLDPLDIFALLLPTISMLVMLTALVSLAVAAPTIKRSLETKYQEKHRATLKAEELVNRSRNEFRIEYNQMMKYLVMAKTSSPQFVMARSAVCTTSGIICVSATFVFALVYSRLCSHSPDVASKRGVSVYGRYGSWILGIQFTGMLGCILVPIGRCFNFLLFCLKTTYKIENHWIQNLADSRNRETPPTRIWRRKYLKYIFDARWYAHTLCIGVQVSIVLVSKLLVSISALPFLLTRKFIKQYLPTLPPSNNDIGNDHTNFDHLRCYVLLLVGEEELPEMSFKIICRRGDSIIREGRKIRPTFLIEFLRKSVNDFNGVARFDNNQIPSCLHSEEPPNCWTLPLVTLTTIAIALPNIEKQEKNLLLFGVRQGMFHAKIVENFWNEDEEFANIREAAYDSWSDLAYYMKWQGIDLRRMIGNSIRVLQQLAGKAERTIMEFKTQVRDFDPLCLPPKVIAANSMYRISGTILLSLGGKNGQMNDDQLFEQLSVMIADIFAACFTNLPRILMTMCHCNYIEERENNVYMALQFLGRIEEILEVLQNRVWPPSLDPDKAGYIDEWRALSRECWENPTSSSSASSNETLTAPVMSSEELELAITVDC